MFDWPSNMALQRTRGLSAAQVLRFAGRRSAAQLLPVSRSPLNARPLGHADSLRYLALAASAGLAIACASGRVPQAQGPPLRYQDSAGQWRENAGEVKPPVLQSRVAPSWPVELRSSENTGTVVLDVLVDRDGLVRDVMVIKGLTRAMELAAIRSVKQWRYEPATLEGMPVAVRVNVTVTFNLH